MHQENEKDRMKKIIVLDGCAANPGDLSWEPIKAFGDLVVYDRTAPEDVPSRIHNADYVFTNKVPISRESMNAAPRLRWIGVLATGYNIVDVACAKEKGIPVANIPSYSTPTVVQNVFALLLHICHHVGDHAASVSAGKWSSSPDFCFWDYPQIELSGKTMGILGYGSIGRSVANTARSLGMRILVSTPHPDPAGDTSVVFTDIDTLRRESDVLSLHCPLTEKTKDLINADFLKGMKPESILINTGRGPLIVEEDLAEALNSGTIFAAGLDVLRQEPPSPDNPLFHAKNCFITPHVSWSSKEARIRLMEIARENLASFVSGKPINVVNP